MDGMDEVDLDGVGFDLLVDDALNDLIASIQDADPVLAELKLSPRHQLAFRTFAWLRAGIVLGQCLVERDIDTDGDWVSELWDDAEVRELVTAVVEELGYQIASDPSLVHARAVRPDPSLKMRFLAAAAQALGGSSPSA